MNSLSSIPTNIITSIKKIGKEIPTVGSTLLAASLLLGYNNLTANTNSTPITHSVSLTDTKGNMNTKANNIGNTLLGIDGIITSQVSAILTGHQNMCNQNGKNPNCHDTYETKGFPISYEKFIERIHIVNNFINTNITPEEDINTHGINEHWSNPIEDQIWRADCENYVLAKFEMLAYNEGIPRNRMRMAIVKQDNGSGHAIGLIDTDMGIVVIDNLTDETRVLHKDPQKGELTIALYNGKNTTITEKTINTISEGLEFYGYQLISYWGENGPKEYKKPITEIND